MAIHHPISVSLTPDDATVTLHIRKASLCGDQTIHFFPAMKDLGLGSSPSLLTPLGKNRDAFFLELLNAKTYFWSQS